jgi:hypothetical protein
MGIKDFLKYFERGVEGPEVPAKNLSTSSS